MGDFVEDGFEAFKYGFAWVKDIGNWKSYGLWLIAYFLIFASIIAVFGVPLVFSLLSTKEIAQPDMKAGFLVWMIFGILTILTLFWVFQMFIIAGVMVRSLAGMGINAPAANSSKVLSAIWLSIILSFKLIFMWYDFKWLAMLVASIILIMLNPLFMILAFFMLAAYYFALIYYSVRLSFSLYAYFASDDFSPSHAIDASFALTNGFFWKIVGRNFIAGLLVGVVFFFLFLLPNILAAVVDYAIGYEIFSNILNMLVTPLQVFTGLYVSAYIYVKVLEWNKERLASLPPDVSGMLKRKK